MEIEKIIGDAYSAFSKFSKPAQYTKYNDFEDAEFNTILLSVSRRELSIEHVGTVAWGPTLTMTPEALAYFMPRLIELAVTNAIDRDGAPFFCYFINTFHEPKKDDRFSLFGAPQKDVMADTFRFLCEKYCKQLEFEGWLVEAQQAIDSWSST